MRSMVEGYQRWRMKLWRWHPSTSLRLVPLPF